jgi:hypothetical protein
MRALTKEQLLRELEREIALPCPYWRSVRACHPVQSAGSETCKRKEKTFEEDNDLEQTSRSDVVSR